MEKTSFIKKAVLLITLQNILYGFGDPISKAAYETVSVYSLLTIRYTIAFLCMLFLSKNEIRKDLKNCSIKDWLMPSIYISAAYITDNIALVFTAATSVSFIRSLSTALTPVLAFIFLKKKYSTKHIPYQILIVIGLYLLCGYGGLGSFGIGEIVAFICAILTSAALISGEKAVEKMSAKTLTCLQCGVSALMAFICALTIEKGVHFENIDFKIWMIIIYLAVLCTLAGYLLQNKAVSYISASDAALWQCLCPVMTAVFSFFILGETLSIAGIIGAVILVVCTASDVKIQKESY